MNWNFYFKYKDFEAGLKIQRNAWITISLAIITIGGAILSTPLWMEVANALSVEVFGLALIDEYSWIYGFICIAIGVFVFIYGQKLTVNQDLKVKHDISIFNQMDTILTEAKLNAMLSNLENDHSYYNDEDTILHNLFHFADQTGNKFIDKKLNSRTLSYINSLKQFDYFAKKEFDIFPRNMNGNYRRCLKPNWNEDRDLDIPDIQKSIKYDELGVKLDEIILNIRNAYKNHRKEIKNRLKI